MGKKYRNGIVRFGVVCLALFLLVAPAMATAPVSAFQAGVSRIINGDFETGGLSPWSANVVSSGTDPGVQMYSGSYIKGTTGIRIYKVPAGGGAYWMEQDVDLTNIDGIQFYRFQPGRDSQELQVLVDDTIVAQYSVPTGGVASQYDNIDLSSYGFSGIHTLKFNAQNNHATKLMQIYLDDIRDYGTVSGPAPLNVQFVDQSTGSTSFAWDFGDGTTSALQYPSHIYTTAGTYTVTLTVTNVDGSDEEVKTDYITVGSIPTPEFPTIALPAAFLVGMLGAVLIIRRIKEN